MKQSEKDLLRSLKSDNLNSDEPLSNVKKGLGSVANVVGNPLFKAEINFNIFTYFYDVAAGVYILPAALPAGLQTFLPVYLFGLTDFYSGYPRSVNLVPPGNGWRRAGITGLGQDIVVDAGIVGNNITFLNPLLPVFLLPIQVSRGDFLMEFRDNLPGAATYIGFVRITCDAINYGTFLNSFVSDLITVNMTRLIVPPANINQLINPLIFGYQTLFGKFYNDSIDPRMFQTPDHFQNQIADIPINFPIDKNLLMGFRINFDCQQMSMVLFVEKVEPLTHKQVKILKR